MMITTPDAWFRLASLERAPYAAVSVAFALFQG